MWKNRNFLLLTPLMCIYPDDCPDVDQRQMMSMTDRLDSVITVRPLLHWYPLIIWTLNYPTQTSILLISMFLQNFDYHKDSQQVDDAGWWRSCIHSYFWQIDYWECFVECSQVCSLVISPDYPYPRAATVPPHQLQPVWCNGYSLKLKTDQL